MSYLRPPYVQEKVSRCPSSALWTQPAERLLIQFASASAPAPPAAISAATCQLARPCVSPRMPVYSCPAPCFNVSPVPFLVSQCTTRKPAFLTQVARLVPSDGTDLLFVWPKRVSGSVQSARRASSAAMRQSRAYARFAAH